MSRTFTLAEVDAHSSRDDLYLVVHGKVYNITDFIERHPGGEGQILDASEATNDVTDLFESAAHSDDAREILKGMLIGKLREGEEGAERSTISTKSNPFTTLPSWLYVVSGLLLILALGKYNGLIQKSQLYVSGSAAPETL